MTVGFVILAHRDFGHVARLAAHLHDQNAPVVIHLDRQSAGRPGDLRDQLPQEAGLISTRRSEWGRMGLVEATLDAAEALISAHPALSHVYLLCGATVPLRPVEDLRRFLMRHSETDFIEAADPDDWITGGLGLERFTLHHPFSWKRQRWFFDRTVDLQRRLGVCRTLPDGLTPRLGRQWWCLRTETLRRLMEHAELVFWKRFFERVWIPDESFFQTVVASIIDASHLDGRGLTLTRFDADGNPITFHDDHRDTLDATDHFFVRKVDPDASGLRDWAYGRPSADDRELGERSHDLGLDANKTEHAGMQMAGRFPRGTGVMRPDTARPYLVLLGADRRGSSETRQRLQMSRPDWVLHGHVFGNDPAAFPRGTPVYRGNIAAAPRLRDYRPEQYLRNLIWMDRDRFVGFNLAPDDNARILDMVLADPNARIVLLEPDGMSASAAARTRASGRYLKTAAAASVSETIGEIVAFAEQDIR